MIPFALLLFLGMPASDDHPFIREDPAKIKTAEACRECHASAFDVWKTTPHAKGFKTLHRKEAAKAIADKMGFKLIKRESACLGCHYTPIIKNEILRAASGVSCESCHGAGADWIDIHNTYGPKGADYQNETAAHKEERIRKSREAGMLRSSDLYPVAARCFQCHTVPDERLVNVGGHGTGSNDFELVSWSQGVIRHNFLESFLTGDGSANAQRSPQRKRVMYVLGRALDLEYSLRGLAEAKEKRRYFKAMQQRLRSALSEIRAIRARVEISHLKDMTRAVKAARIKPDNAAELLSLAENIGQSARDFLNQYDGSKLGALDGLVAGTDDRDLEPEADHPPATSRAVTEPLAATESNPPTSTETTPRKEAGRAGSAPVATATGAKNTHLRPRPQHKTIGPGKCGNCHGDETNWWYDDRHSTSLDPFFENNIKNVSMARLYGISTAQMTRGDALCMDCHGTVVSGKEKREVRDGVSCESCHGPAADYLEPHSDEKNKELGLERPGYQAGLSKGMVELKDHDVNAGTCASCHYITDQRLLSVGHPSGRNFDLVAAMGKIKHWDYEMGSLPASAWSGVLSKRGPIPDVPIVRLSQHRQQPKQETAGQEVSGPSETVARARAKQRSKPVRPVVPKPRPVDPVAQPPRSPGKLQLPPFPDIGPDTSTEEILKILQERLKLLHEKIHGGPDESGP